MIIRKEQKLLQAQVDLAMKRIDMFTNQLEKAREQFAERMSTIREQLVKAQYRLAGEVPVQDKEPPEVRPIDELREYLTQRLLSRQREKRESEFRLEPCDGRKPKRKYVKSGQYSKKGMDCWQSPTRKAARPAKPSPVTAIQNMRRAISPASQPGLLIQVDAPKDAIARLVAEYAKNPRKGWTYDKIGVITGTDSKFVWRYMEGNNGKPCEKCTLGESQRLKAAADIVEVFNPPEKSFSEKSRVASPELYRAVLALHLSPKREERLLHMAQSSGRGLDGVRHLVTRMAGKGVDAKFGHVVLWQLEHDEELREVIYSDPALLTEVTMPRDLKLILGTRK